MMRYLVVCVLFATVCLGNVANDVLSPVLFSRACAVFGAETQILAIYCSKFKGEQVPCCNPHKVEDFTKYPTTQFKFGGCDIEDVKRFMATHRNVTYLDISQSGYDNIDDLELQSVIKLNASHNSLTRLPGIFYQETAYDWSLREIDLSYNKLQSIGSYLEEFDEEKVPYGLFDGNLPNLEITINLSNNLFENIDLRTTAYDKISELSVNKVYITWKQVGGITWRVSNPLRIVANSLFEGIFKTLTGYQLHCHENSFESITQFDVQNIVNPSDLFQCLGPSLRMVSISGKSTEQLNTNVFRKFPNLVMIVLRNIAVPKFDFKEINHLRQLTYLLLENNNITSVKNVQVLGNLNQFQEFSASGNKLLNIQEIIQNLNPNIKSIVFSDANAATMNLSALHEFKNLRRLDITKCNLTEVDLSKLPETLTHLNLEGNELSAIDLTELSHLEYLKITNNRMTREYVNHLMENDAVREALEQAGDYLE